MTDDSPTSRGDDDEPQKSAPAPFDQTIDLAHYQLSSQVDALPDDIDELRREIDRLDAIILGAVKRRSAVSKKIGAARMASGGTRLVHSREVKVLERFADLGQEGHTLAMLLLRLGRGPLGR
ncbi:chorismate mutase [Gordonia sp. ABSL1-1]|uniref:chorismate mutase n=1 Tax=Gordonia sp. ABSL1-1 TaxID=3053923 RepID=UPI0025740129|nr:chorismate mutase [Gordonia sp. ABSL1-1]MDL9937979.1 chorismate mutase [Gordonia sp. ABSL1-1]